MAEDGRSGSPLLGRLRERQALARVVADVTGGRSRVLVLRGAQGVGKSALLTHVAGQVTGWRTTLVQGREAEREEPYRALHRLCQPLLGHRAALPPPQRVAVERTFGLRSGPAPDPVLLSLATHRLLAESARRQPLACLVDDAHWLDPWSAEVLAFAGRRLSTERVALVCAARPLDEENVLALLPVLHVRGLAVADACRLLLDRWPGQLDPAVAARMVAECVGDLRTLLELPRTWTTAQLAGGFGVPEDRHVPPPLQELAHRVRDLPSATALALTTASAEPLGDPQLLRRALDGLGTGVAAVVPALDAGVLREVHDRVAFVHPLARDVVYGSASADDRRRAHRALAEVTDRDVDPDRYAWHRACAAEVPDEDVAAALERSAARARTRAGLAAGAALLTRAAQLTPDATTRGRRAVDAAVAGLEAGVPGIARPLLGMAQACPADEALQARTALVGARLAWVVDGGEAAIPALTDAAGRLLAVDRRSGQETCIDALGLVVSTGRSDVGGDLHHVGRAVRTARPPSGAPSTTDLLLDALLAVSSGADDALRRSRTALDSLCDASARGGEARWLWHGGVLALTLWDVDTARLLSERHLRSLRTTGARGQLPLALDAAATLLVLDGELAAAAGLLEERRALHRDVGIEAPAPSAALLAAWQGRGDAADPDGVPEPSASSGTGAVMAGLARALRSNGLGRPVEALEVARGVAAAPGSALQQWCWVEAVEAATGAGRADLAVEAVRALLPAAQQARSDWGAGMLARAVALTSVGEVAEDAFRRAVEHLRRAPVRVELARTRLLYGEWLRQAGRRRDARQELAAACELFTGMGCEGFADRARRELDLAGAPARVRRAAAPGELTAQEEQIALLARDGLSNTAIGAMLFLSNRTVEWHLRKVFAKLGISSRRELRRVLSQPA